MPYDELVHPKMTRAVFDLLPDDDRSLTANPNGTHTIYRHSRQHAAPMPVNVELVDEPLLEHGRVEFSTALQVRLARADRLSLDVASYLTRHLGGDWGEVTDPTSLANDIAVLDGSRPIASCYRLPDGLLAIITDQRRSRTRLSWSDAEISDPAADPEAFARSRSLLELVDAVERAGEECEEPRRSVLREAARRLFPIDLDDPYPTMPDPPVEIDLTNADWWRTGHDDRPGGIDGRILTTIIVNGVPHHVLGIELTTDEAGVQDALQGDEFERVFDALGDEGHWQTIEWEGREYGLIITPFCG